MGGGGGGGDEDEAAAAAQEARESLERMWANSAGASDSGNPEEDSGDDQLLREVRQALPELQGEGADGDSAEVRMSEGVVSRRGGDCRFSPSARSASAYPTKQMVPYMCVP